MKKIFLLSICFLIGCATFQKIPDGVHEISICDIVNNTSNWIGKEIYVEGNPKGLLGNEQFILQCLHNLENKIDIDTSSPGVMPVETSDRIVKVYGKLLTLSNRRLVLKAVAIEFGESIEIKKENQENRGLPSGGHQH